jgi:hypothetical protein
MSNSIHGVFASNRRVPVVAVVAGFLASTTSLFAQVPPERATTWNPGIPGGIPHRTVVCANVPAGGNIQAAIDACPAGQVVQLGAGTWNMGSIISIQKPITLRGLGPSQTRIIGPNQQNVITIGTQWFPKFTQTTNFAANAAKGSKTITLAGALGLQPGEIVIIDQLTDANLSKWGYSNCQNPGDDCRRWFTRPNRPIGQVMEVAAASGATVTFVTPLHIDFLASQGAQLSRISLDPDTAVIPVTKNAGVEDLYVRGTGKNGQGNIWLHAAYSWVRNVESELSDGSSISLQGAYRCVVRDSKFFNSATPQPGGAGYLLDVTTYSADNLIENNIFIKGNKVMVMRASGGGNVIGYNYFEDGYISGQEDWVETGANASHMTTPHMELFEGNQAFNFDGDNTWGNAINITVFRNHFTGRRRSIGLSLSDTSNRRAVGLMEGHWWYTFLGNVLGEPGTTITQYQQTSGWNGAAMWRLGYNPENWDAAGDPKVLSTVLRGGNFDYATNSVRWENVAQQALPASLYLTSKPAFFGGNPWPWVDPLGGTKLYTLPARTRFDTGGGTTTPPPQAVKARFYTVTPCRVADTRIAPQGPSAGPFLLPGQVREFPVTGRCNVPADARAVAANVTSVIPGSSGYFSLFAPGAFAQSSTVNFVAGGVRANNATLGLGASGTLAVLYVANQYAAAHFLLDVVGYYK